MTTSNLTHIDLTQATPKHLTNPSPAQLDEATTVLRQAFKNDPLTPIFSGDDPEISRLQFKAGIGSAAVGGALHILVVPNDESPSGEQIVGVAVWFPPGMSSNATPEQRAAGWDDFLEAVGQKDPYLKTWWHDYFIPRVQSTHSSLLPEGFTKDAWHLHLFGILPEYQGKGLGKKLFKFAEEKAKSTSSPIILETATDLDILIYRRLGLDVVGDTALESNYGNGKMTIMVRKWE